MLRGHLGFRDDVTQNCQCSYIFLGERLMCPNTLYGQIATVDMKIMHDLSLQEWECHNFSSLSPLLLSLSEISPVQSLCSETFAGIPEPEMLLEHLKDQSTPNHQPYTLNAPMCRGRSIPNIQSQHFEIGFNRR